MRLYATVGERGRERERHGAARGELVRAGAAIALATALLSGVSIYVNSFAVRELPDPFVFTTAKNAVVALVGVVAASVRPAELRGLGRGGWARLATLGLVGGGIPFLLFFEGLRAAAAPSAAFMHKTLVIWVALLALPLLRERLGALPLAALAVLLVGHLALAGRPSSLSLGRPEALTLAATLLWAAEAVLARRFLAGGLSVPLAALGRMGFGVLVMLAFLATSGRADDLAALGPAQWGWVLATAALLLGYVGGYYAALRRAPATMVASILVVSSVVTSALHAAAGSRSYSAEQAAGLALIAVAAALWLAAAELGRRGARAGGPAAARAPAPALASAAGALRSGSGPRAA